jgi:hypothetical protein
MLGVYARGIVLDNGDGAFERAYSRSERWAAERDLVGDREVQRFLFATMCLQREGAAFDACAAQLAGDLEIHAPRLFAQVVERARRMLETSWSRPAFSAVALAELRAGREEELRRWAAGNPAIKKDRVDPMIRQLRYRLAPAPGPRALRARAAPPHPIGDLVIDSGVVVLGDPRRPADHASLDQAVIDALPGRWNVTASTDAIVAAHASHPRVVSDAVWIRIREVGIVGGIAGVFDASRRKAGIALAIEDLPPECTFACHVARDPDGRVVAACIESPTG